MLSEQSRLLNEQKPTRDYGGTSSRANTTIHPPPPPPPPPQPRKDAPSMDVQLALKRVLKSARIADGISRGLHEAAKALDKRTAHFCVFATACDEPSYEKLVRALCKQHSIPIFEVEDKAQLGEWVGQCKYDKEGQARKVVGCSCAVVRSWGRDEEAKKVMEEYFNSHRS